MTTKTEALKLALEALETAWYHVGTFCPTDEAIDLYDEARAAIKEALAQPEQEPVAYQDTAKPDELVAAEDWENIDPMYQSFYRPLYTTPPQRKPLTDEQADSIINGLRTCLHLDSKRVFLKTWLCDWAAHGIKE